jgi:hypothetical protein
MRSIFSLTVVALVLGIPVAAVRADGSVPPPVPEPDVLPVPGVVPAAAVPTLAQFAAAFKPLPGRYEVTLLHPATGQPVTVNFTLPPGAPRKVRVHRYRLAFDYGRHDVVLVFRRDGSVRVRN